MSDTVFHDARLDALVDEYDQIRAAHRLSIGEVIGVFGVIIEALLREAPEDVRTEMRSRISGWIAKGDAVGFVAFARSSARRRREIH